MGRAVRTLVRAAVVALTGSGRSLVTPPVAASHCNLCDLRTSRPVSISRSGSVLSGRAPLVQAGRENEPSVSRGTCADFIRHTSPSAGNRSLATRATCPDCRRSLPKVHVSSAASQVAVRRPPNHDATMTATDTRAIGRRVARTLSHLARMTAATASAAGSEPASPASDGIAQ